MNPLSGSLKFVFSAFFNSLLALVFFVLAARFTSPAFVGKVAIVQLLEASSLAVFSILPTNLITREISYKIGKSEQYNNLIYTTLSYAILISPFMLGILFLPSYLWLAIPYLILNIYSTYQGSILAGLGKFTEINIGSVFFSIIRWGVAILAIIYHSFTLFIIIWTIAGIVRTAYYHLFIPFRFHLSANVIREMIKVGLPIYLSGIIGFIASQGDRVITAYLLGSYWIGIYQLLALISNVPYLLIGALSSAILPSSTFYYAKGAELKEMSSTIFRITTFISLPLAILAYAVSPLVINILFPTYREGILALQILILVLTSTTPIWIVGNFLIIARKDLRPYLVIGLGSAIQIIAVSYLLIPKMSIVGAAIAQAINIIFTVSLSLYFLVKQEIFELNRENVFGIILMSIASLAFVSWITVLIIIVLGFKLLGIIKKKDIEILEKFAPAQIKGVIRIFDLFSSTK